MEPLLSALVKERFGQMNEVQQKAWPAVTGGLNALIVAPTGFGKTEAALLPLFERLLAAGLAKEKGILILYITPLKALNRDMQARIEWWCAKLGLDVAVRHGDTKGSERSRQAGAPPQIMITTPETLAAMLVGKRLGDALANVRAVIVDEVHELYGDKRGAQLALSLERLVWRTGREMQRIGLSATIADADGVAQFLVGDRLCEKIVVGREREMSLKVVRPQASQDAELASRLHIDTEALGRLLFLRGEILEGKTLVFVNTRSTTELLVSRLLKLGCKVAAHHGSLSRDARLSAETEFKEGRLNALVCTSSLELGIDIGAVEKVVQYSSPRQAARLLQRIGRSGHSETRVPQGILIATDAHDAIECEVLVERALKRRLEKEDRPRAALDVLAHALAGIAIEQGRLDISDVLKRIRRAAPYAGLSPEIMQRVAEQLVRERILKVEKEGATYGPSGRALIYYYKNVSTIPHTKKFAVRNAATNRIISSLDEEFVASLEAGEIFLSKGVPWRVLDVGEEIIVEPSEDIAAALPDWSGEQIPITYEVAQDVCMRRHMKGMRKELQGERTSVERDSEQLFEGVPTGAKAILIEKCEEQAVMHLCGGMKANKAFAQALGAALSAREGVQVRTYADAYCIILQVPYRLRAGEIAGAISRLQNIGGIVRAAMIETHLFAYRLTHVARLFGLIENETVIGRRAVRHLEGTPIFEEAAESALADYFDTGAAEKILEAVKAGRIELVAQDVERFSPLGRFLTVRMRAGEFLAPIEPTASVLQAFAAKISAKSVRLLCTYCGRVMYERMEEIGRTVACRSCGSVLMAPLRKHEEPAPMLKKNKEELRLRASLVEAYGGRAILCLNTYGVGSRTAARILAKLHKNEKHLFFELLEAQKTFIRTKRYWTAGG
ncbi:MAG: DEAD/DEAH box helicase [Candidatus Burarchaeum sp.]|nr:DEAD/DEAH box helicase [Candidatus Burarchaeum sp.]MDO8339756.1 DEAD/DEAH box helicase [Candidatus Burarchaeum sp.]